MSERSADLSDADRDYVEKARSGAERLGVRSEGPDAARDALADLEKILPVDADPPAASASLGARTVKSAVLRLARWYVAYLAGQVTAIGEATVRLGSELADRIDDVDRATRSHETRIDSLEQRVQRLEGPQKDGR